MKGIQTADCMQCGKTLRGVADTRLVCPMCNAVNHLPAMIEVEAARPADNGWKRLPDETPITVRE